MGQAKLHTRLLSSRLVKMAVTLTGQYLSVGCNVILSTIHDHHFIFDYIHVFAEAEHGYACSLPIPDDHNQQHLDDEGEIKLSASPNSLRKSQGSR